MLISIEKQIRITLEKYFVTNSFIFLSLVITPKTGRKSHLTETQRDQIDVLQKEGYSERQIGARISCSKNAVHKALEKFRKYASYCDKPKLARPQKTSKRDVIMIKRVAVRSRLVPAIKIAQNCLENAL